MASRLILHVEASRRLRLLEASDDVTATRLGLAVGLMIVPSVEVGITSSFEASRTGWRGTVQTGVAWRARAPDGYARSR